MLRKDKSVKTDLNQRNLRIELPRANYKIFIVCLKSIRINL
jgi:hypothetical protein